MSSDRLTYEQEREMDRLLAAANLHRMRGQLAEAEQTCRKALTIAPGSVAIREMLADILHEIGKLDEALAEYRSAMEMSPGKPSLETKYAKVTLEIAERERERAIARDMLENPHKYTQREKSPTTAVLTAIVPGLGQFYNGDLIKAIVIWSVMLLFLISWRVLPSYYHGVRTVAEFIQATNPLVLVFGVLFIFAYFYSLIDAAVTADRRSKARGDARKQAEL